MAFRPLQRKVTFFTDRLTAEDRKTLFSGSVAENAQMVVSGDFIEKSVIIRFFCIVIDVGRSPGFNIIATANTALPDLILRNEFRFCLIWRIFDKAQLAATPADFFWRVDYFHFASLSAPDFAVFSGFTFLLY